MQPNCNLAESLPPLASEHGPVALKWAKGVDLDQKLTNAIQRLDDLDGDSSSGLKSFFRSASKKQKDNQEREDLQEKVDELETRMRSLEGEYERKKMGGGRVSSAALKQEYDSRKRYYEQKVADLEAEEEQQQ